ncbi:hypothetical protein [Halobacillus sp. Nhm2S1]|uniref:hypothetical protein n=1 Tax=Halobacillus sp. Nhm2S1 TaxID=2866716 RepID=UPI001C73DEE9|nr:hypothetical protein [Halobacillus sp. Nhm2S1]MBX0356066.1 hypothetical protein [Halobacillus sp. Nhm2S1]
MRFNALQFNNKRMELSGQCFQRIDGSLIIELNARIPFEEVSRLTSESISYLWVGRPHGEKWYVHSGPFRMKEQWGIIILTPEQ